MPAMAPTCSTGTRRCAPSSRSRPAERGRRWSGRTSAPFPIRCGRPWPTTGCSDPGCSSSRRLPADPLPVAPERSLASLGTHDLPRFAAFWDGADIDDRERSGAVDRATAGRERTARNGEQVGTAGCIEPGRSRTGRRHRAAPGSLSSSHGRRPARCSCWSTWRISGSRPNPRTGRVPAPRCRQLAPAGGEDPRGCSRRCRRGRTAPRRRRGSART